MSGMYKLDLTGKRFGKLTVIKYAFTRKGKAYWHCKCDCGNEKDISGTHLVQGDIKSCGCYRRLMDRSQYTEKIPDDKFIGMKFGMLTVIKRARGTAWLCKCDCGNYKVVERHNLVGGDIVSCGCKHKRQDISGMRVGKLLVTDDVIKTKSGIYYGCICDCGTYKYVRYDHLRDGVTRSCGCWNVSTNGSVCELSIKDYIQKLYPIYSFKKTRKVLDGYEIDIYIPEIKVGIEYNGSAFHASKNGIFSNKDKYYHRDKFLLARSKGIKLITVFDKYFEDYGKIQLNIIRDVINGIHPFIPLQDIEYTDNNYDYGLWMKDYGYEEIGQAEPNSFIYTSGNKNFLVYDCGKTIWKKNCLTSRARRDIIKT